MDERNAAGSVSAAQAFSFNSLAQAAGLGLPQMRPVPRGAAKLEEIERRQSGSLEVTQLSNASASQTDSHTKFPATSAPPVMARAESAPAAEVSAAPSTESPFAALAPDQPSHPAETGKALLNMLASTSAASSRAASVTPPPGFATSKAPSAINWGSSNHLQGIWGAPTSTPGLTGQPDWGPPPAAGPAPLSAAFARSVSPATSQLLPQQQMMQQHIQQEASAPHIDQRLLLPLQGASAPFPINPAAPFTGHLDQLSRAQQAQQALAALSNRDASAASVLQQDSSGNRAVDASQNPLLALLGRHNASATQGDCCYLKKLHRL